MLMYFCMTMRRKGKVCLPAKQCKSFHNWATSNIIEQRIMVSSYVSNLSFKSLLCMRLIQWLSGSSATLFKWMESLYRCTCYFIISVKTHESIKGRMSANALDRASDVNTFIKCNYWMTWSSLYFDLVLMLCLIV